MFFFCIWNNLELSYINESVRTNMHKLSRKAIGNGKRFASRNKWPWVISLMQSLKNFVHDTTMNHVSWKWEAVIYLKLFMNQWHGGKWKSPQKQNLAMLYLVMPKVHTTFKVFKANVSSLSCTSTDPANFVSSHRTCLCWCSGMWLSSVHVSSWYYILIAKADVIKLILKHGNVKWSMKFKTRRKQTLGQQSV